MDGYIEIVKRQRRRCAMNDIVSDVLLFQNNDFYADSASSGMFEIHALNPQSMLQSLMDTYSMNELSDCNLH